MPEDLKLAIAKLPQANRNQLWVSCSSVEGNTTRPLKGISYFPTPSIPGQFYPYMNNPGYMSPLVAIKFYGLDGKEVGQAVRFDI